jgi:hypothetical protein
VARAYHYTVLPRALGILESEVIRLSDHEHFKAVWFSTRTDWEPAMARAVVDPESGQAHQLSQDDMASRFGLARFETSTEFLLPLNSALVGQGRFDSVLGYAAGARLVNSDSGNWHVALEAFPLRGRCTGAQLYTDGQWVAMTPETLKDAISMHTRGVTEAVYA